MFTTAVMFTARHITWSRWVCFAIAFWFVSLFCAMYILNHDAKLQLLTLKHLTRTTEELKFLQKKNVELKSLFEKCYFGFLPRRPRKLSPLPIVTSLNKGNIRPTEILQASLVPPLINFAPSVEYETLRRKFYSDVQDFWWFISSEVNKVIKEKKKTVPELNDRFNNLLTLGVEYKRSLLTDVISISAFDGHDSWRQRELDDLSTLVQQRIEKLQNPADCSQAKKFTCTLVKTCCYACVLHHLTYCLIMAFGHGRTLILKEGEERAGMKRWESMFLPTSRTCQHLNFKIQHREDPLQPQLIDLLPIETHSGGQDFLPGTIPKDLASRLTKVHSNPEVWWTGQFLKYLMKYQPSVQRSVISFANETDFDNPIVGVHVHRPTRFDSTGTHRPVKDYMSEVEDYFLQLNLSYPVTEKTIFLATNDIDLFEEIQEKYPDYSILGDGNFSLFAVQENQCNSVALNAVLTNVHYLARTDFLVCAFSSEVCRLAYEVMNSLIPDAFNRFRSIDRDYYFEGQVQEHRIVTHFHKAKNADELSLTKGSILLYEGNLWNGYSRASIRVNSSNEFKSGIYPTFKAMKIVNVVDYLTHRPYQFHASKINQPSHQLMDSRIPFSPQISKPVATTKYFCTIFSEGAVDDRTQIVISIGPIYAKQVYLHRKTIADRLLLRLPDLSNIINQLDNSDGDIIVLREPSTFDTVIGCIEDILIDDNFSNMQKNFLEKYWHLFENSEENKLYYMDIFQEYTNMIEIFIEKELSKKIPDFFMQSFIQELIERKNELDGEVFEMLFTLTDFIAFKQMVLDYKAMKEGHIGDLNSGLNVCSLQF